MMAYFSTWLKQIILLVLLGTFMDLLLPNSGMKRYVKLVMGLLILLMILSPIFHLFQGKVSMDDFARRVMQNRQSLQMEDRQSIREYGESLMQQREEQTRDYVAQQMGSMIESQIEEDYEVNVQNVDVSFTDKGTADEETTELESIRVVIRPREAGNDGVRPVEPVVIEPGTPPSDDEKREDPQTQALVDRIRTDLAYRWEMEAKQIQTVLYEEEGGGM